ncbi:MAG: IS3 family transposase [Bacteroidales bacterium]|nr:IS3 family transposase [Bacteroidales bacterium]
MKGLYDISGVSRQAYHKAMRIEEQRVLMWQRLKEIVIEVRKDYPRISARKVHYMLGIKEVGINRFERFVSEQGLGVRKYRSFIRTTYSGKIWYPNLIHGIEIKAINQLWVSDITYFVTNYGTFYIVFIMDIYSRRIIGYTASDNLQAVNNHRALSMVMRIRKQKRYENLIHHSDKGSQYSETEYINRLNNANIQISMAENCLENAYAERINGTIKNDYLRYHNVKSLKQLKIALGKVVKLYNTCPHSELGYLSPIAFEKFIEQLPESEYPVMQLYDFRQENKQVNKKEIKMGFLRYRAMKIQIKEKAVALQNKTTAKHFPGSGYSLEGYSPAEPSSASPDHTKLNQLNKINKLSYQQLK